MSEQETEKNAAAEEQNQPEKRTYVEDGSAFKGELVSSCHVVVLGSMEGELQAPKLTVAESGSVVGNVRAERIESEGVLAGTIEADELYLSGQVREDTVIRAKSMQVKLSQNEAKYEVTFGACTLEVGEDPRAELAADAAASDSKPKEEMAAAQPGAALAKVPEQEEAVASMAGGESAAASTDAQARDADGKAGGRKRKGKQKREEAGVEAAEQAGAKEAAGVSAPPPTPSNPPPA